MTDTLTRPSTPLRRALGLEWRRHCDLLLVHAALAVMIALIAVLLDTRLGVIAILLAARLPADLADRSAEEGRQLRSALGVSRADAVRARTVMVCAGQLVLALGACAAILLTDWGPSASHWSSVSYSTAGEVPEPLSLREHLLDIGLWSGAILWTHALSGGGAFRLGGRPSGIVMVARFLGLCLLAYVVLVGSAQAVTMLVMSSETGFLAGLRALDAHPFEIGAGLGQALALAVLLGGGAVALLLAHRRWVRRA